MGRFRKPEFKVEINGQDYTSRFSPVVKSIDVDDKDGLTSDTCTIKLADKDGMIAMPGGGDMLRVWLGDSIDGIGLVFEGRIDEVRSTGTKGGGRELTISAKGVDTAGKAKEPAEKHKDDAKFGDVAKEWGKAAGFKEVVIDEEIASFEDDYWSMNNESFLAWAQRTARELGATFKVQGDRAIFVETNGGKTASGKDIPVLEAKFGPDGNIIKWDVSPVMERPRNQKVKVEYYDPKSAKLKSREVEVESSGSKTESRGKLRAPNEKTAERRAKAGKKRVQRAAGEGSVTILGTADAKPEGQIVLSGCREGVDGEYRNACTKHRYKRSGYLCEIELKQPAGKAGKDSRRKTKASSGNTTGKNNSAANMTGSPGSAVG